MQRKEEKGYSCASAKQTVLIKAIIAAADVAEKTQRRRRRRHSSRMCGALKATDGKRRKGKLTLLTRRLREIF